MNYSTKYTSGPWNVSKLGEPAPAPEGITEAQRARWDEILKEMGRPFRHNDGSFNIVAGEGDDRKPVATATFQGKAKRGQAYSAPDPEGLANAQLIAAAPDLLAACKAIEVKLPDTAIGQQIRAAIAKAEGGNS